LARSATDLAVIKVDARNLPFVSFEDRAKPRVGDWVVAVGNPLTSAHGTAGIVSALGRKKPVGLQLRRLHADRRPINRGNSAADLRPLRPGGGRQQHDLFRRRVGGHRLRSADVVATVSKQLISTGKVTRGFIGAQSRT